MIARRILRYGIAFVCIFFVLSCISLYQHREILSSYLSNSLSAAVGIGLYLLLFAVCIGLMLKALFR